MPRAPRRVDRAAVSVGRALAGQPRALRAAESVGLVVVVAALDWLTGPEVGFSLFYLAPIVFGAWFVSSAYGALIASLSAAAWL